MKKRTLTRQRIWLAVWFAVGFLLTYTLSFSQLQQYKLLFMLLFFAAAAADLVFLIALHRLLKRTWYPRLAAQIKKMTSAIARKLGTLAKKLVGRDGTKVFLDGKHERKFVFEVYGNKTQKTSRKMPKLAKNASEKEKIRHAYVAYVFRKNKNIPSVLTPNEVERELDATAEEHPIFENYNAARYAQE